MISIDIFPANNGDCFLICIDDRINILVDAGYEETAKNHLIPKLRELSVEGKIIDLFVITHIDEDHIGGAIELIRSNGHSNSPKVINIKEVWHNSYRHISQINTKASIAGIQKRKLCEIIAEVQQVSSKYSDGDKEISAKHGSTLAALLLSGEYNWNITSAGRAVSTQNIPELFLGDDVKISLLSPDTDQLISLDKYWRKELYKCGYTFEDFTNDEIFDDAMEYLLKFPEYDLREEEPVSSVLDINLSLFNATNSKYRRDTSPKNGSSIAFLLEVKGKKLLFSGDSFSEVIEKNLKRIYPEAESSYIDVDVFKVSHHGSSANNSPTLLKLVNAQLYIVSTDGSVHNHPSIKTLAHIIFKEQTERKLIVFNYSTVQSEMLKEANLKEKYNYDLQYSNFVKLS